MRIFIAKAIYTFSMFIMKGLGALCALLIGPDELSKMLADAALKDAGIKVYRREDDVRNTPAEEDDDDGEISDEEAHENLKGLMLKMSPEHREQFLADALRAEIEQVADIRARTELVKAVVLDINNETSNRG